MGEACVLLLVLLDTFAQIIEVPVEERGDEVMIDILQRLCRPTGCLEIGLVQHIKVILHLQVRLVRRFLLIFAQILEHVIIHLLRVLHVGLVTHRSI